MTTRYVINISECDVISPHYESLALYYPSGIINFTGIGRAGSDICHYQRSMIMSKCSKCGGRAAAAAGVYELL